MEAGFEAVIATAPEQRLTCDEGDVTEAIEEEEDVHDVLLTMSHVTGASLGGDCEETEGFPPDTFHFPPFRGDQPANTDQYYADQYDQYYR